MILVITGTHDQDFSRLIKEADRLASKSREKFIMQTGHSETIPEHAEQFDFADIEKMRSLIAKARVVITHGGIGSITDSLSHGKPTVVVPRRKMFGEHTNDHQLDITKEMERQKMITAVYDIGELKKAVSSAKPPRRSIGRDSKAIEIIKDFLSNV